MSSGQNKRLRIAVQKKGRLNTESMALFEKIGIKVQLSKSGLYCHAIDVPVDFLFVRDDDIPTLVNDGFCDVGIIGQNVLDEFCLTLNEKKQSNNITIDKALGFGACRLSIAIANSKAYNDINSLKAMKVATSYPELLMEFSRQNNLDLSILNISGSVEIAPNLGMADAICDLVSTGRTLEENNLKEVVEIMQSQALLIRNSHTLAPELEVFYQRLIDRMNGVMQAKESKYVMFHAPKSSLNAINDILPGHEGQTIIPIAGVEDKVAVHIVTTEGVFWNTLERLKQAGASAILVLPIEKMLA
ncbi:MULTISPECIES: ATP phosphoribosyltransferase [Cysteiniphilum]|uniref:ATP phosphoribosyltransferase n=1 Tax=Cysteiniphilum litorale TaxID=2056700 RepID=A0A8J2Z3F5_9GAMM|nr:MULTISPECIES: ATP phosphoribosyltransferase [Cysteiniphilum]GGF94857.1 ATP phosphoribosyltransferase [Cysteiniphilum litorale]